MLVGVLLKVLLLLDIEEAVVLGVVKQMCVRVFVYMGNGEIEGDERIKAEEERHYLCHTLLIRQMYVCVYVCVCVCICCMCDEGASSFWGAAWIVPSSRRTHV